AAGAVVCCGRCGRAFHGMGRERPATDRRAGTAICAYIDAASPAGRPRAMVLRLEGALAGEPDVYLPSLEDRFRRVAPISLPSGIGGAGGCSRLAGAQKPWTDGGLS